MKKKPNIVVEPAFEVHPLNQIDFYKADHRSQYPDGITSVYSNMTARMCRLEYEKPNPKITVFGQQAYSRSFLIGEFNRNFFSLPKDKAMAAFQHRMDTSLGKGSITLDHVEDLWNHGYLPLRFKNIAEGSRVNVKVPFVTTTNTTESAAWIVNSLETVQSQNLWGAATSASTAFHYLRMLHRYAIKTGGNRDFVKFQAHDFSMRGMWPHAERYSGGAHLLSFVGTDSVPAIDWLEKWYFADPTKALIGTSVFATEHSVMCMEGVEGEFDVFERLITKVYPDKEYLSIVSDTYSLWRVCTNYLPRLKEPILKRSGKVIIRPDSGDPIRILCGEAYPLPDNAEWGWAWASTLAKLSYDYVVWKGKYYQIVWDDSDKAPELAEVEAAPALKGVVELLWDVFGGTTNSKGYKHLNPKIGAIYGDSITPERADAILEMLERKKFASDCVVLGVGSYTYQYVTRDTWGTAMKATHAEVNGVPRDVFKDPETDNGKANKKSAKGLLMVTRDEKTHDYQLHEQVTPEQEATGELNTTFEDSEMKILVTLDELRERQAQELEWELEAGAPLAA